MNTTIKASPQSGYFFPKDVCNFETYAVGSRVPFDIFAADFVHFIEGVKRRNRFVR
eukprot:m.279742 g.279742  ORF g.279742 m.279742 type:complete len:56 (+) comp19812_c0_seq4:932-1099(+)